MSKVIKSAFATKLETEKKTISLKNVFSTEQQNEKSNQHSEKDLLEKTSMLAEQELQRALAEANEIRLEAENEYQKMQQQLNEQMIANQERAEQLFKQAEENGYNEGFQHGLEEGKKQYEMFIEKAKEVVTASKDDYIERLEEAEPDIVQLALKVASKIINETIEEDKERWLSIVKNVITEVREQEQVKIYIHPNWYESALAHKEELKLLLPNSEQLFIYPDVHLDEYGCMIETAYGKIDATVDSQLNEIKFVLLEKLKELAGYEGS